MILRENECPGCGKNMLNVTVVRVEGRTVSRRITGDFKCVNQSCPQFGRIYRKYVNPQLWVIEQ